MPPSKTRLDLPHLLEGAAESFPNRPALGDAPHRLTWSGTQARSLTLGAMRREAGRIAGLFDQFHLTPGAVVAVALANVPEAVLTVVGLLRAGLRPVMLPVGLSQDGLVRIVEETGAEAAVTMTTAGELEPAATLRDVAARCYDLRFLTTFGAEVPDGMIGLDRLPWSLAESAPPVADVAIGRIATYDEATGQAYLRTGEGLMASGLGVVAATRMRPGQRIVSLLPPDDLAGLATGLVPSLAAGVPLLMMGLFDSAVLKIVLDEGQPTHLVAPGWLEPQLAASPLGRHPCLTGLVFVHKLPFEHRTADNDTGAPRLGGPAGDLPIVDVLALGEHALFISQRVQGGRPGFDLGEIAPKLPTGHALAEARVVDGMLELRGRAARCRILARGNAADEPMAAPDLWAPVPFTVERDGSRIVSLERLQRTL